MLITTLLALAAALTAGAQSRTGVFGSASPMSVLPDVQIFVSAGFGK